MTSTITAVEKRIIVIEIGVKCDQIQNAALKSGMGGGCDQCGTSRMSPCENWSFCAPPIFLFSVLQQRMRSGMAEGGCCYAVFMLT